MRKGGRDRMREGGTTDEDGHLIIVVKNNIPEWLVRFKRCHYIIQQQYK